MNNTKYDYSILLIEDENILRKNYIIYLKTMFEFVYEATDGVEAYNIYKEKRPNILIIDINIPKINGLDLLQMIRQHDHTTKAIVLTAHKDKDFLLQATKLKLTDYLVKPISRRALKLSLEKVIDELTNFKITALKNKILKDGYIWNYDSEELTCNGKVIHLTNKEKLIFTLFMNNLNSVLSIDKIIYSVWDEYLKSHEDSLKTILKKLRRKLPNGIIINIHSIGYKINV
ncbi:response regulator [Poseidonibacter lekithochrous]|uniref:response regulator transcription factor n=1 Tax=Poseidonibacter TaxID=2321187 RepID=UPI001C0891B2|nr:MULTISPECIES: response regulator [Poseidonibacter]MBU3015393.1 response regulator [Poseidonibacter lekithochrous]MDO6828692.1 response regulator [Poseidonibacter sp. 1_MG-2023]